MITPLMTEPEVLKILRLTAPNSNRTLRGWVRRGKLRGYKVGREWRFREEDVQQFLRRSEA